MKKKEPNSDYNTVKVNISSAKTSDVDMISLPALIRRLKHAAILGLFLVLCYVVVIVFIPMEVKLRDSRVQEYTLVSHLDYYIVKGALMRGVEAASGLSSRSMIRNAIGYYKDGLLSFDELKDYSSSKYNEGAKTIDYLLAAYRFVDNRVLVSYLSKEQQTVLEEPQYEVLTGTGAKVRVSLENDRTIAEIKSPIVLDDTVLGYDLILYDMTPQLSQVYSQSIELYILSENEYDELLTSADRIISNDELITLQRDETYYSIGEVYENVYIMTEQTESMLFENIMTQTKIIMICGILLLGVFVAWVFCYIVRYVNKGVGRLEYSRDTYKRIAYIDFLTKAYTRSFLNVWNETIREENENYYIVLIDVDKFKSINDTYGHQKGDLVLSNLSKVFIDSIREKDYFIRYGGDEFLMILAGISEMKLYEKMELLEEKLKNIEIQDITIGISYGISRLSVREDMEEKIKQADKDMYKMKQRKLEQQSQENTEPYNQWFTKEEK